jgi:cysteine desulfuration protein SufE
MKIDSFIENFEFLEDWEERYNYIVDLGSRLPEMPAEAKNNETLVHGCVSNVWVTGRPYKDDPNRLEFEADSDTPIVKGLVAILVMLFTGKTSQEVLDIDVDALFSRLHLDEHLSPNRHVGVYAMVEKIKGIAKQYTRRSAAQVSESQPG